MSDFIDDIKISVEDKKKIMLDIWYIIINLNYVPLLKEIPVLKKDSTKKLSEEELLAIYSLSVDIRKAIEDTRKRDRLFKYLGIENNSVDSEKLYNFTKEIVADIRETRKKTPNVRWELQVNKILDRIEGKNPYKVEEVLNQDETNNSNQKKEGRIINLGDYYNRNTTEREIQ